tara:strand:+ start:396 stop:614 length:219 start_codon:yes stop_codon:yes gene_type:complete
MTTGTKTTAGSHTVIVIDGGMIRVELHRCGICIESRIFNAQDLIELDIDRVLFSSNRGLGVPASGRRDRDND